MNLSILGTTYEIIVKKYNEEEAFECRSIAGFCDGFTKKIVVCDMSTYKGWENEEEQTIQICQKQTLRHEIVHAFFVESGLMDSASQTSGSWATNEEMVDWFALQGQKIYKAWMEAGCL